VRIGDRGGRQRAGGGVPLEGALRDQTTVMDDVLARRVSNDQALDRLLPRLTTAAKDRQAFVDALASYQEVRAACQQ
jgi:hypothetical protein